MAPEVWHRLVPVWHPAVGFQPTMEEAEDRGPMAEPLALPMVSRYLTEMFPLLLRKRHPKTI